MQRKVMPRPFGDLPHKIKFYFDWIFGVCQIEPLRNPGDMRIHHDTRYMKSGSQYHIGGLAPHTRKFDQFRQIIRHLTRVSFHQGLSTIFNTLSLISKESGGSDKLFDALERGFRKSLRCRELSKKRRCDLVDLVVRTLSRQYGRHQQFKWIAIIKLGLDFRIRRS